VLGPLDGPDMHVAMISAEYPPRWGGMGSTVHHLSRHLVESGNRVTIITRNGAQGDNEKIENIDVIRVPWARIPMYFTRSYAYHALKELEKVHKADPFDVIHLHLPMISLNREQIKRCRSIAPVVASLHGSWMGERDGLVTARRMGEPAVFRNPNDLAILLTAKHYSKFEKVAASMADIAVSNSDATRQDFEQRYGLAGAWNCETVHWGVDDELFTPFDETIPEHVASRESRRSRYGVSEGSPLILAVGRLAARKGYTTLLRAFPLIRESDPRARLLIVGRGGMKSKLMSQASKMGFSDAIAIESSLPFDELSEVYRASDLTVFPSYYEGQGLIPLESMSSGVPIVATNEGPIPEMVDENVGALFEMGDHLSLAEVVIGELSNKEGMARKGDEGRKKVLDKFTFKQSCQRFESIYRDAMGARLIDQS
jgi:glycosyltransferase involved in cell wall biosynthesis